MFLSVAVPLPQSAAGMSPVGRNVLLHQSSEPPPRTLQLKRKKKVTLYGCNPPVYRYSLHICQSSSDSGTRLAEIIKVLPFPADAYIWFSSI